MQWEQSGGRGGEKEWRMLSYLMFKIVELKSVFKWIDISFVVVVVFVHWTSLSFWKSKLCLYLWYQRHDQHNNNNNNNNSTANKKKRRRIRHSTLNYIQTWTIFRRNSSVGHGTWKVMSDKMLRESEKKKISRRTNEKKRGEENFIQRNSTHARW